jgi:hypothetical protein
VAAVLIVLAVWAPRASGEAVGAVGGVASPVTGVLNLSLDATDAELGLSGATVTLDGVTVATRSGYTAATASFGAPCVPPVPFGEGGGAMTGSPSEASCPTVVTDVALAVDTSSVSDGPHQLEVTVTDGAGAVTTLVDRTITVANTQAVQPSSVTLALGSGASHASGAGASPAGAGGSGGAGGVLGSTSRRSACASPRLSMVLAQRPLRISPHGLVVLRAHRRYRYTGHLTCLLRGKRVAAAAHTVVQMIDHVGRRTVVERATAVRAAGRIVVLRAYPSSRMIVFEAPAGKGRPAVVRILIEVVRASRARRG